MENLLTTTFNWFNTVVLCGLFTGLVIGFLDFITNWELVKNVARFVLEILTFVAVIALVMMIVIAVWG